MNVLGRYSELVTALVTVFVIASAVTAHALGAQDTTFIDAAALLGLGALYGKQSAANGYAKEARAAHVRLDRIHAPAADASTGDEIGPRPITVE